MFSSLLFFIKAVIAGFAMAAPVGPIGLLCISRALRHDFLAGLAVGIGAASADMVYGLIAASSLNLFSSFLLKFKLFFQAFGGCLLIYLSYIEYFKPTFSSSPPLAISKRLFISSVGSTFLLTLTNPMTLLLFLGVLSSLGTPTNLIDLLWVVTGIFVGSMLWWVTLTSVVTISKKRIPLVWLTRINHFSAVILLVLGIIALASAGGSLIYHKKHTSILSALPLHKF